MKKIIMFSAICALAGILFTSCNSNWSISKRHFNNGYYVDNGKNKHAEVIAIDKKERTKGEQDDFSRSDESIKPDTEKVTGTQQHAITVVSGKQTPGKTAAEKKKLNAERPVNTFKNPSQKIKETFSKINQKKNAKEDGEGLSLFWIIILIILILWVLGVISTGFAIGSIINLLLLAALILLILWLLRIV